MMLALGAHLLESTVFALFVGVLTVVFWRRGPATRYILWLLAVADFLLPSKTISLLGSRLAQFLPPSHASRTIPVLLTPWVAPSTISLPPQAADTSVLNYFLLFVWLLGCLAMLVTWLAKLRKTPEFSDCRDHALEKCLRGLKQRVGLRQAVTLRFSDSIAEPLLFGFCKPIVMLPMGLAGKLSPAELESVILHELAHAKRRDNWTAAFSHVVTCIFWFYPLLWWIEQRLRREREFACDEMVVRYGAAQGDYVASILKVCRLQLTESAAGVSGVCGSNLKNRMEAIMSITAESMPRPTPKLLLGSIVAAVVLVPVFAGFFFAPIGSAGTYGQNQRTGPTQLDQASAVGSLRSINTAEVYYSRHYPSGFSPTLLSLGVPPKGVQPSASAADLLNNSLTSGTRNAYIFTYTAGSKDSSGKITTYTVTARPITWERGVRSFFTDQTGLIRWTDKHRAPRATDTPIQ